MRAGLPQRCVVGAPPPACSPKPRGCRPLVTKTCVCARTTLTRADSDTHAHSHTHTHWGVCRCDCVREIIYSVSQTHSPELSLEISTWSQGRARGPVLRPAFQEALDKAPSMKSSPVSPALTHTHIQLRGRRESVWMLHVQVVPLPSRSTLHFIFTFKVNPMATSAMAVIGQEETSHPS